MGGEALSLERLAIRLGGVQILRDITLDVPAGSFTCLLGPSGCGKTTLLRAIAGFAPPSEGDIRIGGRSIAALPPEKRETAMVFQSYALWPHMSVGGNLAYPLKLRRVPKREREEQVARILDLLDLPGFADRPLASLSGGQRQRVALGRALIIDPPILLLDEPLSNLDAAIRRNLRSELRSLQQKVGITTIMVTHDQEEALSMADTIVLMRAGQIVQVATPEELFTRPADLSAGRFLGIDNLIRGRAGDPLPGAEGATLGFRSAEARIAAAPPAGALARHGTVVDCAYAGGGYQIRLDTGGESVSALSDTALAPGTAALAAVPAAAVMAFGADEALLPH
ncbi:ABC transporter ATP-binding protein [Wenxinia marina]|uniref:ABC-type spermidine/putrescine transport system, ATPase component n=1 Tax=Wenxinia marina DSM 24838 TaxID=1123501 RepID=A0A0D0QGX3_9RHOB|nr:ABC transporter ATP-binding protein [Wenxinia marina]KIQ70258.1 ABC-type spermidine/putrescine transport system, ATPase component [Wenxinia marina DSM 24838]GGL49979.1 spermidine/putrescine ABC transporter ATP-binding protein [Wenxinia marina]